MFFTQLQAAKQGVITNEMKIVARKEGLSEEQICSLVAAGKVVIPCNKNHKSISPEGIGKALRTKINANLGTSKDCKDYEAELDKVQTAVKLGADSIMDLSTHGDTRIFRRFNGKMYGYDRHGSYLRQRYSSPKGLGFFDG